MGLRRVIKRNVRQIIGEPNRFLVDSDEVGVRPYLVDLEAMGGNGECGCPLFGFNRKKVEESLKEGVMIRCKHIEAAVIVKAMNAVIDDAERKLNE